MGGVVTLLLGSPLARVRGQRGKGVEMALLGIARLVLYIEEARAIYEARGTGWEIKYNLIFGLYTREIIPLLSVMNIPLVWTDPDTGYENDVTSLMEALLRLHKELKPFAD